MSHRRTFSARFPDMTHVMLDSPPPTPIPNLGAFPISGSRKHRAYWARTTFLAGFALVALSVYLLVLSHPALRAPSLLDTTRPSSPEGARWSPEAFRKALKHKKPVVAAADLSARPQITLNATQELGAVSSFIASLPQNTIPATVDPSLPIDPQLILDFDTRGPHAQEELQAVMQDVWIRNPVMFYSKVRALLLFLFSVCASCPVRHSSSIRDGCYCMCACVRREKRPGVCVRCGLVGG